MLIEFNENIAWKTLWINALNNSMEDVIETYHHYQHNKQRVENFIERVFENGMLQKLW